MTFHQFVKSAGFELYDYKASMARNWHPHRTTLRPEVVNETQPVVTAHPAIPHRTLPDVPVSGKNTHTDDDRIDWRFTHSFDPSISGTGSGRPYWDKQIDPYGEN